MSRAKRTSAPGLLRTLFADTVGIVPLVFIVLKLTGVITWSWWWVLSPLWIGGILAVLWAALAAVIFWLTRNR